MDFREKNTKITAKISDLHCEPSFIEELYNAGLDVVWLNTAHQDEAETLVAIENTRKVSNKIAIMIDTKGPEVRTLKFDEVLELETGDELQITGDVAYANPAEKIIGVDYPNFHNEIQVGAEILIDDGSLKLTVREIKDNSLLCVADNNGKIKKRKSVNVPNVHIDLPTLTEKDKRFLKFSVEHNVDFIAHSFVRSAADVKLVRDLLDSHGENKIKIIAKIENREGVDNIEEILDAADGVMVARGDLAVEVPAAEVPLMQKAMIEAAARRGKTSMVATQMLDSMIENPRPTRAEVSDIATAILDGVDSTCLSGETAYGKYPVEAVKAMSLVSLDLKKNRLHTNPYEITEIKGATPLDFFFAKAAFDAAVKLDVKAIIVPSVTGRTARYISSLRSRKPIYAFCYDETVMRQLALKHAIRVDKISHFDTTDEMVYACAEKLLAEGKVTEMDQVVVVAGTPHPKPHRSNFFEIATVKDLLDEYKG